MAILAFLLTSYIVYGLPVIWLMRKDIKKQFIEQGVVGTLHKVSGPLTSEVR